ncbi:D-alanine transfer protein [Weissella uvarum]|uniref:D-alanyl-lipoteichoic acid biosynthesis protein DltD n=1 Tax=Weissella uvarum TaxID=1479233 RepID=UPI00196060F9|nr:D-alanyl-lipoteichoic acid biosynthesis protein DltD [Weissella uvarum]MBM7616594.1 D-alanine transfer protein [Weissella uvarum]MCM0594947.1 D-alanyl-lipoteichoic acid biosynthesis protein DltD [Weissella uvarum]
MRKKLWLIFGPLLCAMVLVVGCIFAANTHPKHNLLQEKRAAVATSATVFKSSVLKNQALGDPNHRFVPFFGSSEWTRTDSMHPAVLADRYHRGYRPFLLGQKGATSLTHYFAMQQMLPEIQHRQAVFVISPQWFVPDNKSTLKQSFPIYYSNAQGLDFLKHQRGTEVDRYAAKRFLKTMPSSSIKGMMQKVADGQPLSNWDRKRINLQLSMNNHEDAFFSDWKMSKNYENRIVANSKHLPKTYNRQKLSEIANKNATAKTDNNDFGINNTFYMKRFKGNPARFKNTQKHFSYEQSQEYNDFQLVLEQFAASDTNVMFVIPPVNEKWSRYTGLSQSMYQKSVAKMKYQLHSQGFNNVADLSRDGGKKHFMQDTIHLGWQGWLAFDDHVAPFLMHKQKQPHYQMNHKFFDKSWANYKPKPHDKFTQFKQ